MLVSQYGQGTHTSAPPTLSTTNSKGQDPARGVCVLAYSASKSVSTLSTALIIKKREPGGVTGYWGKPGDQTVRTATRRIRRDLDHIGVRSGALVVEESTGRRDVP